VSVADVAALLDALLIVTPLFGVVMLATLIDRFLT
jgi:hypothetical protein